MWNAVGIIKQFNTEEEESIDIEFHNTAIHHAMHLTNSAGYTMADVSTEAVVLASPGDESTPRFELFSAGPTPKLESWICLQFLVFVHTYIYMWLSITRSARDRH